MAKSQTQRTNEYRTKIKQERDALLVENAELKRRLTERNDTPAQASLIDKLSLGARAKFDQLRGGRFASLPDDEALAAILNHTWDNPQTAPASAPGSAAVLEAPRSAPAPSAAPAPKPAAKPMGKEDIILRDFTPEELELGVTR